MSIEPINREVSDAYFSDFTPAKDEQGEAINIGLVLELPTADGASTGVRIDINFGLDFKHSGSINDAEQAAVDKAFALLLCVTRHTPEQLLTLCRADRQSGSL